MKPSSLGIAATLLLCACAPIAPVKDSANDAKVGATGNVTVSWKFEETRRAEYDQPFSNVSVVLSGDLNEAVLVGEFSGVCAAQKKEAIGADGDDVLLAARCWWAGAGEDFLVRRKTAGELRIEHRSIDEGTAEEPAPVFPFKLIGEPIAVPSDATIR